MDIQCIIAGEACRLTAVLEPGASPKGAMYTISKDGQTLATIIRYPNGNYVTEGESDLTADDVSGIGNAINEATDRAGL